MKTKILLFLICFVQLTFSWGQNNGCSTPPDPLKDELWMTTNHVWFKENYPECTMENPDCGNCPKSGEEGIYLSNCTMWAWYRSRFFYEKNWHGYGNAGHWDDGLPECGTADAFEGKPCLSKPMNGAMMIWQQKTDEDGKDLDAGHVAIVECVDMSKDEPEWIYVSEYNRIPCSPGYRKILAADWQKDGITFINIDGRKGSVPVCASRPRIEPFTATVLNAEGTALHIELGMKGTVCSPYKHRLKLQIETLNATGGYTLSSKKILELTTLGGYSTDLRNLAPCSKISYILEKYTTSPLEEVVIGADTGSTVTLPAPTNFRLTKAISTGTFYYNGTLNFNKVCNNFFYTTYSIKCTTGDPNIYTTIDVASDGVIGAFRKGIQYQCELNARNTGTKSLPVYTYFNELPYDTNTVSLPYPPSVSISGCNMNIDWKPLQNIPNDMNILYYIKISRKNPATQSFDSISVQGPFTTRQLVLYTPEVAADGDYGFQVRATDINSNKSSISGYAVVSRDCFREIPTLRITSLSCSGVALFAEFSGSSDPGANIKYLRIYKSKNKNVFNETEYEEAAFFIDFKTGQYKAFKKDMNVEDKVELFYKVKATYQAMSGPTISGFSEIVSIKPDAPPLNPANFIVKTKGHVATISFQDKSNYETSFELKRVRYFGDGNAIVNTFPSSPGVGSVLGYTLSESVPFEQPYQLILKAVRGGCKVNDPNAAIYEQMIAMATPSNLAVKSEEGKAHLMWINHTNYSQYYQIIKKTSSQTEWTTIPYATITGVGSHRTWTDNIPVKTGDQFKVRAVNKIKANGFYNMNYSELIGPVTYQPSNICTGADVIKAPDVTGATCEDGFTRIYWKDQSNNEAGFNVEYRLFNRATKNFNVYSKVGINSTMAGFFLSSFDTDWITLRVVAFQNSPPCSSLPSDSIQVCLIKKPNNLVMGNPTFGDSYYGNFVVLKWNDPSSSYIDGKRYEVKYLNEGDSNYQIVSANYDKWFLHSHLEVNKNYQYRVRTTHRRGNGSTGEMNGSSAWSDPLTYMLKRLPDQPMNITGLLFINDLQLMWNNAAYADSYTIERFNLGNPFSTWSQIGTATGILFKDTNFKPGAYMYRVKAVNKGGNSPYSSILYVTKFPEIQNLYAVVGCEAAQLYWDDVQGSSHYQVQKFSGDYPDRGSWNNVKTVTSSNFSVYSLFNGNHYYRIKPIGDIPGWLNFSSFSNPLKVSILQRPTLSATGLSGSVVLNWTQVFDATSYSIYVNRSSNPVYESGWALLRNNVTGTTYTHSGLEEKSYYYKIKAINASGSSCLTDYVQADVQDKMSLNLVIAGNSVKLDWKTFDNAVEYRVEKFSGQYPTYGSWLSIHTTTGVKFTDVSLNPGIYHYRLRVKKQNQTIEYSNEANGQVYEDNYLRLPDNPTGVVNGLSYKYYESTTGPLWDLTPQLHFMDHKSSGSTLSLTLTGVKSISNATKFDGFINVSVDGIYTFYTQSDDGSMLYIGNHEVVDNRDWHVAQTRSGRIGLKKGKHALTVIYHQRDGSWTFNVKYAGPNLAEQNIPDNVLFRKSSTAREEEPVNSDKSKTLHVYPNPAQDELNIILSETEDSNVSIGLYDLLHKEHYKTLKTVNQGINHIKLPLSGLSNGIYFLQINGNESIRTVKIIISK